MHYLEGEKMEKLGFIYCFLLCSEKHILSLAEGSLKKQHILAI